GWPLPASSAQGPSKEEQRALLAALSTTRIDWGVFGQHLAFDASVSYVRRRLFLNSAWEILLLNWLPGQATAIHDHGDSWGATLVLMGELVERQFRWHGSGVPMELRDENPLGTRQVTVETQDTIHTVANRGAVPAVSLHLYSPPLTFLHAYDLENGGQHRIEPSESRFYTR
ncbi:MAG TPA: cysteine dioxygenase family protein, partial [Holophagaceae bacterium]|nr:cysteine dioxygenase family protein [Holophagaceae bacterium]